MNKAFLCALMVALIAIPSLAVTHVIPSNNQGKSLHVGLTELPHPDNRAQIAPGEGDPMPTCYPGKNCGDTRLKEIAGEGDPMPTCYPGKNCGDTRLKEIAGEGDPMPTCYPGKNCGDTQLKKIVGFDPFKQV